MKRPYVTIMASRRNGTIYVGVTSDIARRAAQHQRMDEAIDREKQIKSGSRKDKLVLIERDNPFWNDLYETLNA
ncbi:GIY-YIG nuclease family protein [Roseiarcus sp.]|uniref:GIY-YIG nuclease family protein n=1 Tax=Roseiarcus sp. TaxID=1969460 RepID=UPI003D09F3E6